MLLKIQIGVHGIKIKTSGFGAADTLAVQRLLLPAFSMPIPQHFSSLQVYLFLVLRAVCGVQDSLCCYNCAYLLFKRLWNLKSRRVLIGPIDILDHVEMRLFLCITVTLKGNMLNPFNKCSWSVP